jgi:beta-1,4-mannosyl-glycoprotein beta-1,4-N-acetylglucosaminyltransferase
MKIFDCFMYFDEEMLLDLRLNILDKYVDKFIINEATYMHSGKKKKLNFDINKFSNFKHKIIYNVIDKQPTTLEKITEEDKKVIAGIKLINNSNKREHYQREMAKDYLNELDSEDIILINDLDEIPNLEKINLKEINNNIVIFKQKMFYYKFNLIYEGTIWHGSKACNKKKFISPQWLRDVRHRKYPLWRVDTIFSKTKYPNIIHVEDGGWHFTNIKSPENVEKKYSNFLHHQEFEYSGLKLSDVKKIMNEKKILYDHEADQRDYKFKASKKLTKVLINEMPEYIINNREKYSIWLDN